MASGAYRLPYALFQEVARVTGIAATASGAATNNFLTTTVGSGVAQTKQVFGRIIGAESVDKLPGVYGDTVVVTIAF
jgi:spore coat protein U-like protein